MVWAKLDDAILDNPKIANAGVLGFALHIAAITWCCRNLTDGFIPRPKARLLLDFSGVGAEIRHASTAVPAVKDQFIDAFMEVGAPDADEVAEQLIGVGLWRRDSERDGYWLKDFLEYNPSRQSVLAERDAKAAAGKLGAEKRWGNRQPKALAMAPEMAPAMAKSSQTDAPVPDPVPVKIPLTEDRSDPISAPTRITPRSDPCPPAGSPPEWFLTSLDVIAMGTGVALPPGEAWLRYDGHRAGKGIAPTAKDAQYWLTTVMVPEARELLRVAARDKERDAKFDKVRDQAREPPGAKPRDSRKEFRERDEWAKEAGPPDPETAARMKALLGGGMGKVGT